MAMTYPKVNKMYYALKKISKEYMTPQQLRKAAEKEYGVSYEEALEMAYENIQQEAREATRGIRISDLSPISELTSKKQ